MTPLLLVAGGAVALLAGVATLRSLGPGYRIGRLLTTAPKVSVADALRIADGSAPRRYVAIEGRIDSDDAFEDLHQRPLVLRRTRIEVRSGLAWRRVEESVEVVPFEVVEALDSIGVDTDALGDGLVVIPRISEGVVADLAERVPAGYPPATPARATIDQVSSIEHATVIGWPVAGADGRPLMTTGGGRPLVLSVLEPDEAMRVLAGGERLRPGLAAGLFVLGLALAVLGLAWAGAAAIGAVGAAAAPVALVGSIDDAGLAPGVGGLAPGVGGLAPAVDELAPAVDSPGTAAPGASAPEPSGLAGDTRSSGEGPGLVGAPGLAIAGVLLVGGLAAVVALLYVRLTGGPHRP